MVHRCCSHIGNNNQAVVVVLITYSSLANPSIAMASEAKDAVAFGSAFGDEGGRLKIARVLGAVDVSPARGSGDVVPVPVRQDTGFPLRYQH